MFCDNCGAKLDDDAKFCRGCGKQVGSDVVNKTDDQKVVSQSVKIGNWITRFYKGRIGRKYWILGTLFWIAALFIAMLAGVFLLSSSGNNTDAFTWFFVIAVVVFYFFALGLGARRFHDMDQTGWMVLVFIIPLANLIALVYMLTTAGAKTLNKYGPPLSPDDGFFKIILNQ